MGRGNPESADVVIARGSKVFIACKLSDKNKKQLNSLDVEWVELRSENGFKKFRVVLENLGISYQQLPEEVDVRISEILDELLFILSNKNPGKNLSPCKETRMFILFFL